MKKPKILLVDDKKENLFALEEILDDLIEEVEIVSVTSGNDAVSKCLETEFAIILMDVQMPEMDGYEAMNLIHRERLNAETPVIFLSAIYSDDSYKIKGIREGAVDFLSKPIVEGILIGKVNVFLRMYEQKMKMTEQMKEIISLNRDMENFSNILAHDLKQPLNIIQGYLSLVMEDAEAIPTDTKESLQIVQSSSLHMTNLINEVLELIKTKNMDPDYQKIDSEAVFQEIRQVFLNNSNKKITMEFSDVPVLTTQKVLFSAIFRNLIGNSVKYNDNDNVVIFGKLAGMLYR